jgi:glycerol-3-phosphate O-acyltransferase
VILQGQSSCQLARLVRARAGFLISTIELAEGRAEGPTMNDTKPKLPAPSLVHAVMRNALAQAEKEASASLEAKGRAASDLVAAEAAHEANVERVEVLKAFVERLCDV